MTFIGPRGITFLRKSKDHGDGIQDHRKRADDASQELREHMKVKAGDKVKIFFEPDGHVVLLPVVP